MREIKFRGKRTYTGEWVYGVPIFLKDSAMIITEPTDCYDEFEWNCTAFEVIPETVSQYTGLKDRDDKEIYEGDILTPELFAKAPSTKELCVVEYKNGYFKFKKNGGLIQRDYPIQDSLQRGIAANNQYIIFGNIHDNPELIEEKQP